MADAERLARWLVEALRGTPVGEGAWGGGDGNSAGSGAHSALLQCLGLLGWCRPGLAPELLAPAVLDFALRPPPQFAGLTPSGAVALNAPQLQASALHALTLLRPGVARLPALLSAVEGAARREELLVPTVAGSLAPPHLLQQQPQQHPGGAGGLGAAPLAPPLDLALALSLPLPQLVELLLLKRGAV